MKTFLTGIALVALATSCGFRTPIYRANVKLLVTYEALGPINSGEEARFFATQTDIMLSQTMLKRVQRSMNKSAEEIRNNLTNLKVYPVRDSSIIMIDVDSSSPKFAKAFADALSTEYLKFRDEERAKNAADVIDPLAGELKRICQEIRDIDVKLGAFYKEHDVSRNPELQQLKTLYESRQKAWEAYKDALDNMTTSLGEPSQSFVARTVSILEPAIVEPKPVNSWP